MNSVDNIPKEIIVVDPSMDLRNENIKLYENIEKNKNKCKFNCTKILILFIFLFLLIIIFMFYKFKESLYNDIQKLEKDNRIYFENEIKKQNEEIIKLNSNIQEINKFINESKKINNENFKNIGRGKNNNLIEENRNINKQNNYEKGVAICTIIKMENPYLREWIEYHKNLGVSKFILYDNNEINGERMEDVIQDYIDSGLVKIVNYRGDKNSPIFRALTECYQKNKKNFDWIFFHDPDEYIHIEDKSNINENNTNLLLAFLSDKMYKGCDSIAFKWRVCGDNDLVYYDNRTLIERFDNPKKYVTYREIKVALRGNLSDYIKFQGPHYANTNTMCGTNGRRTMIGSYNNDISNYNYAYIKHFVTKTAEEFLEKLNKGLADAPEKESEKKSISRIKEFFELNKLSPEKIFIMKDNMKKVNMYYNYYYLLFIDTLPINYLYMEEILCKREIEKFN